MFGAGWTEMLIIGVVALVVIGPKDLPIVMRKLGRMVATVRRMGSEFQREINKTTGLDSITELRRSITEPLRQTSDEIVREFNKVTATGVEPTGIMKPLDPKVESVYDQIAATSGITPTVMASTASEPSPAPVEATVAAIVPAAVKPKRVSKAKVTPVATEAAPKPASRPRAKAVTSKTPAEVSSAALSPPTPATAPAAAKGAAKPRVKAAAKVPASATNQPSPSVAMAANDAEPAKPTRARAKKA